MKRNKILASLAVMLVTSTCITSLSIKNYSISFSKNVYATGVNDFVSNPVETVEELLPGIDEEEITVEKHPAEQITEKTIEGVWEAINSKVSITFNTGRPTSALSTVADVLEKLLPIISRACEGYDIEHGGSIEYLNYIPPKFDDNKFDIIAYDPYSTKGRYTGNIHSESDETIFRVKIYPEFSANDAVEYSLKNLEKINLPSNAAMQNLILEFYVGEENIPFEKVLLPADKNNKDYGICLTKTNSKNYVYYLKTDTDRKFNTFMVDKILAPLYTDRGHLFNNEIEDVWNNMDQNERDAYAPLVLQYAKIVDKSKISRSEFSEEYTLSLWQDPRYLLRGNTMFIYGNNYHSNFSENTKKILLDENGAEKANLGLTFNENGEASYQIYIPKTGTYNLNYIFTHENNVELKVTNLNDGKIVYSIEAEAIEDGKKHTKVTAPREIDLEQGLINIKIEGSNFNLNCMILEYLGNKEEQRAEYLQNAYESVRLSVVNAIDILDRNNASREEIENALGTANFMKEKIILVKKQNLLDGGYSPDEPLMIEIDKRLEELEARIAEAYEEIQYYNNNLTILIQGEEPYENLGNIEVRSTAGLGVFECKDFMSGNCTSARYKVTIPKSGYYKPNYFVANFQDNSIINVTDENGRTFDSLRIPKTGDLFSYDVEVVEGTREYFEAGETYIGVMCTNGSFMIDKIQLEFDN